MDFCLFLKFYFWTSTQDRQHDCPAHQSPHWDEGTHGHLRCSVVLINCPFSHIGFLAQNCLLSFYARHTLSDHGHLFNFSAEVLLIIAPTFFFLFKDFIFIFSCVREDVWVCTHECNCPLKPEEGIWPPTGFGQLLGTELLSSVRAVNALNCWAGSPALAFNFLKDLSVASVFSCFF